MNPWYELGRFWSGFPLAGLCRRVLCRPGRPSPPLRTVAPVECDDHGPDKALHSWPSRPTREVLQPRTQRWVAGGERWLRAARVHAPFDARHTPPRRTPHKPHTSAAFYSLNHLVVNNAEVFRGSNPWDECGGGTLLVDLNSPCNIS